MSNDFRKPQLPPSRDPSALASGDEGTEGIHPPLSSLTGEHPAVTGDPVMERLLAHARSVARTPSTVLLCGESGAGKEVLARYIHKHSARAAKNFVAINCAALPASLLESELFGHERGSFTGANQRHIGVFERANGGTLLLDEVSEITLETQAKLLRVLQERVLIRVGGTEPIKLDLRIIATTNRDLEKCVAAGTFRLDLFYRLNVFPLRLPALRERLGDVQPLAQHFLAKLNRQFGTELKGISETAVHRLQEEPFPGNVRELQNLIERAVILAEGNEAIRAEHVSLASTLNPTPSSAVLGSPVPTPTPSPVVAAGTPPSRYQPPQAAAPASPTSDASARYRPTPTPLPGTGRAFDPPSQPAEAPVASAAPVRSDSGPPAAPPAAAPAASTPVIPGIEHRLTVEAGQETLESIERRVILSTLVRLDGNRTRTAEALGVSLRTIRNKLAEYRKQGHDIPE